MTARVLARILDAEIQPYPLWLAASAVDGSSLTDSIERRSPTRLL